MMARLSAVSLLAVVLLVGCKSGPASSDGGFLEGEKAWRAARDAEVRGPESWLTIAGLFWLVEGENAFGTAASNAIVLPEGSAPATAGVFVMNKGAFSVRAAASAAFAVNGKPVESAVLQDEGRGQPDVVELGRLKMWIIKRDERYGVRLRDSGAAALRSFAGIEYFPASPAYRLNGEFHPLARPEAIRVEAKIVGTAEMIAVGTVAFRFGGRDYEIEAWQGETEGTIHFVLGDPTNGKETYGGGRFLDAPLLDGGKVDLNFNRLYNPPCVFSAFATCPYPPPANRLPFRVEAGEKMVAGAGH